MSTVCRNIEWKHKEMVAHRDFSMYSKNSAISPLRTLLIQTLSGFRLAPRLWVISEFPTLQKKSPLITFAFQ